MITSASDQYLVEPMVDEDSRKSPPRQRSSRRMTLKPSTLNQTQKTLTSRTSTREVETELSIDNYNSIFESFFRSMSVIDDFEDLYTIQVTPSNLTTMKVKMVIMNVEKPVPVQLEMFPNEG